MSNEFLASIKKSISEIILGFESGLYTRLFQSDRDNLYLLAKKEQPFYEVFKLLHEEYYTKIYNLIVKKENRNISNLFDDFRGLSNHSNVCILGIISEIAVKVHFTFNRKNLSLENLESYQESILKEISNQFDAIDIRPLLNHSCQEISNLKPLAKNKKFMKVNIDWKN